MYLNIQGTYLFKQKELSVGFEELFGKFSANFEPVVPFAGREGDSCNYRRGSACQNQVTC